MVSKAANRLAKTSRMAGLDPCLDGAFTGGTVALAPTSRLAAAYLTSSIEHTVTPAAEDIRPVALVVACVQGSSTAWDAFVRRYAPLILAIARRSLRARGLSPAPDDLED